MRRMPFGANEAAGGHAQGGSGVRARSRASRRVRGAAMLSAQVPVVEVSTLE
jgi:hypothetical protein